VPSSMPPPPRKGLPMHGQAASVCRYANPGFNLLWRDYDLACCACNCSRNWWALKCV
jgi:hypothetical protein